MEVVGKDPSLVDDTGVMEEGRAGGEGGGGRREQAGRVVVVVAAAVAMVAVGTGG